MSDKGHHGYTEATVVQPSLFDQEGSSIEKPRRKRWSQKRKNNFARFILVVTLVVAVIYAVNVLGPKPTPVKASTTPVFTAVNPTAEVPTIEDNTEEVMKAADWERKDYNMGGEVDQSKDKSTTGDGAFNKKGVRTPAQMIKYLKSGSKSAKALMGSVLEATGATRDEVLDSGNWIAVQSKISFHYPGNTSFNGNGTSIAGSRKGEKGDIFLIFVSPSTGRACAVRGACANPQIMMPTPKDPSKDVGVNPRVAPWKQDGGDKHTISNGDGSKIPNGLQTHPKQDAQAAIDKANADNAKTTEDHEEAVEEAKQSGGGTVDNNETHTVSTSPNW